jgi:hypothetical protein
VIIGLSVAYTRLPGAGGLTAELRWLLAHSTITSRGLSRAATSIHFAAMNSMASRVEMYEALLNDPDRNVVKGTLRLLSTDSALRGPEPDAALRATFARWFSSVSAEDKFFYLPELLLCAAPEPQWRTRGTQNAETSDEASEYAEPPPLSDWLVTITSDDLRWIVASTLPRLSGHNAAFAVFGDPVKWRHPQLPNRLAFLDDWVTYQPGPPTWERLGEEWDVCLPFPAAALLEMLHDPADEVRWAAGRILAVAGDERGLPAFCDWLQVNPRAPRADQMMIDLFGPDWRKRCESGSATSQPGPRDS